MRILNFYKNILKKEGMISLIARAIILTGCFLTLPLFSFSQSCAKYAVTLTPAITYTSIAGSGGTSNFIWRNITSNQNDDNRSYQVPIGFDFWYLGVRYINISAQLNGTVDFSSSASDGNTPVGSSAYGPNNAGQNQFSRGGINAGTGGTMLALAPMYDDLWTAGSGTAPIATSLIYKTSGAAPNRVLTVEWINFDKFNFATGSLNFQVKIYETSGLIEFIYGTMTAAPGATYRYCCGINGFWDPPAVPNAAQMLEQQVVNVNNFNFTPIQNNLNTAIPATNSKLTFTPPTPTAAPTGLSFTAVTKTGMTLNWTNNGVNAVRNAIYNSTDGVNYSYVTDVPAAQANAVIAGLFPSSTYYWQVYAVSEGDLSAALTGTQATLPAQRIISIATGNWNTPGTWDCTCIPTAGDSVIIANGTIVTLDAVANGICYSLTVGQGVSGQLIIGSNATNMTLTVSKDVRVLSGATMTTGPSAATHTMTMGGNLTNNGTLNLAPAGNKVCDVTFNKNGNQTISGTGATTNFDLITLNMGISSANVLEVTSTNFTVLPANFLTLTNGTFKLSTATATLTPFTAPVTIPASAGIWMNNAGATMSATGGTITLYGSLRATAGTLNIGNATDQNLTSYGGTITVDGGTVNIAGRLDRAGVTILTFFTMSSGTLTVATVGSTTAGLAPFMISEVGSTFNMSGGTIIIRNPGAGNLGYLNTGGTVGSVTGGTLQIGDASTPAAPTIQINSSIVIYNLVVGSGAAVTAQLVSNLTVNNNFTINTSGIFNPTGLNITVSGLTTISGTFADGTLAGTSTLQNVDLSGGTISGAANGVVNIQNLTLLTGSGTIGQVALTVNGTTTVPSGFGLTLNNNNGVKTFAGLVTINAGATWLSTAVTTAGILIFQNGITNNNSFSANIATFNTNNQDISGSGAMSFTGNVLISGAITVSNKNTNVVSITGTLNGSAAGSTWKNDNTVGASTLNYGNAAAPMITGVLDASTNSNTVNYNLNGAQNVKGTTYWHLTLSTVAASTKTLVLTDAIVNGNFTINALVSFNPVAQNFTVNAPGLTTINGIFADGNAAGTTTLQNVDLSGGTINGGAIGVVNMQNLTLPTGNGIIGQVALTVNGTTTVPTGFGLTLNNNNGVKTFVGAVTVSGTGTWVSTLATTSAILVFQNGIVSNGASFSAGGATFNTNAQSIGGATTVSFANTVTVTGITLTNNTVVSMSNTAAATLTGVGGTWTQGATGVLNYSGSTITAITLNASAAGNTVNYNSPTAVQTIFNPSASTYNNLSITGGAFAKTLAASTIVNGDISIQGTAIFSVNTFDITLYGNWNNSSINADPFTEGVRTVTFSGTTTGQTITNTGNANGTKFYNLTFSNTFATAPQISLGAVTDVIVGNTLSMGSNDNINLNGRTLTLGTAIGTPGILSYTNGFMYGGTFTRWIVATAAAMGPIASNELGHFPMGTSVGDYRPVWIAYPGANLATQGTVSVVHNPTYPTGTNAASHTDASWTPPVGGTVLQGVSNSSWAVSRVGFAFNAANNGAIRFGGQGFATFVLTDLDASLPASVVGTYAASTSANTPLEVNRTGLSSANLVNTWVIGTRNIITSPLPVELLSFDAKPDGNVVDVTWSTASEFNSNYFLVQRSKDGTIFQDVEKINVSGSSTTIKNYSAVDYEPYNDVSYYRLKQVDNDGKFTFSGLVAVKFHNGNVISVYPNPSVQGEPINVSISGQNGKEVLVVVRDMQGREFYSKVIVISSNMEVIAIDPSGKLAAGVYFVVATSDNNIYEKKIVIK